MASRIAHGTIWSVIGAVISRGSMVVASIFIARILGRDVYGEYGMLRSTMNMFLVFAGFGLGMTATKYVAEFRVTDPERAGRIMALSGIFALCAGLFVAAGLYINAPWVAARTINAPHLAGELRIGAFVLLLNAVNGAQTGALAGFEAFKDISIVNLLAGLMSLPILVGGAYINGLQGAVWALGISMMINWALNHIALRRQAVRNKVPFTIRECLKEWPILWKFSLPAALGGIMISPVIWACNAMLVNHAGGYGQMGLFDAAYQWSTTILIIPAMAGQIVLPVLSNLSGEDEQDTFRKVFYFNVLLNTGMACVVALPVILLSPFIMGSYGAGFDKAAPVLVVLSLGTVLIAFNNVIGQAIASKSKMWTGLCLNSIWAVTLIMCSSVFIRLGYGAVGLALANLMAYGLHSVWQIAYAVRTIGIGKQCVTA